MTEQNKPAPKHDAPPKQADEKVMAEKENTGAASSILSAVDTGVTQDDLNPAFASPESQEKTKKDWTKGAEHTVDAKEANKPEK